MESPYLSVLIPAYKEGERIGHNLLEIDRYLKGKAFTYEIIVVVDRKWLGAVEGLEGSKALAVDDFGFAYVTVSKGRWKEIAPDGNVTGTFGTNGRHPGEMLDPVGIGIVDNKRVWVLEAGNLRMQSFIVSNSQKHARLPLEPAAYVHVDPIWNSPESARVALATERGVLLIGARKNLFQWMGEDGKPSQVWKREGKKTAWFSNPTGAALDANGTLWVTDAGDHTIKKVNDIGQIIQTIGGKGKQNGSLKGPTHIAIRPDGSFVVADRSDTRVQVLNPTGLFMFSIDSKGKNAPFSTVTSLAAIA
jgi:DNA-binding beta-propeller fold protein YncE